MAARGRYDSVKFPAWALAAAQSLILLNSCGIIPLGTSTLNDPVPSGTVLASGSFTGQNGKTASGTATVYLSDTGTYVIRLDGLVVPSENGLVVVASTTSQTGLFQTSL